MSISLLFSIHEFALLPKGINTYFIMLMRKNKYN